MSFLTHSRARSVALAAAAAVVIVAVATVVMLKKKRVDPLLSAPTLALEHVSGQSVYYNAAARPWLLAKRQELLTAADRDDKSPRTRGCIQAVQNPKLFRQLDRQYRFDTLLLVGDPSQYRPLLEHLLEAKDWTLSYLDHTALIFSRDSATAWKPEDLAGIRQRLDHASAADRASFLAQVASKLIAVRQTALANQILEEAKQLDDSLPDIWSTAGKYRLTLGQWTEAIANADHALGLEEDYSPALAVKTQALYATKHFVDAYPLSCTLVKKNWDDPGLLFYHAQIAHEARAFSDEIRTLQHLIDLAEKANRPSSGYRVYLGQAYASDSQGEPALEQFRLAMDDPELPREQRKFAAETATQIRTRIGAR